MAGKTRGSTRGPSRGSKQRPWTPAELALVEDALDNGNKSTRATDLAAKLTGRSRAQCHNALNGVRRKRGGLCIAGCGSPAQPRYSTCAQCRTKSRDRRLAWLKNQACSFCGDPLGEGASATTCKRCRERRRSYNSYNQTTLPKNKSPNQDPRLKSRRVLPWPACGHTKWAANVAAQTQRPVIDPFAGSGEPLRLVHDLGGCPHHYNDMHPGVYALAQCAKQGLERSVALCVKEMLLKDQLLAPLDSSTPAIAAYTYLKARWSKPTKPLYNNNITTNLKYLGRALQKAKVTNLDALSLVTNPHQQPYNALWLIDPPWPGNDKQFEHKLNPDQWATLLNALANLPDQQDFIIMIGAERLAIQLLALHLPNAPAFWRLSGSFYTKSIVVLSPRLARQNEAAAGQPIDYASLGLAQ